MPITEEDRKRMGTMAPEMEEYLKDHPMPDLSGDLPKNRAEHLSKLRHLYPIPGPIPDQVKETTHHVPVRDGSTIPIRIYTPTPLPPPTSPSPIIVMFHEGGWSMGDLTDEDQNCRLFSRDLAAVCVNVEYRLAPAFPFPTGVEDAVDVVRWCASTASPGEGFLPGDPRRGFVVGGASAGGNLAAVVAQVARDEGLMPPLTGQYLAVPALLWPDVVPEKWKAEYRSRREPGVDPVLKMGKDAEKGLFEALRPDTRSPRFSPLLHPNLRGLPPAFFQLGDLDPLRDEGLIYERVLREENGVPTKLNVYDGFGHMFWTNFPTMQRSHDFVDDTLQGMKWLLEVGKEREVGV